MKNVKEYYNKTAAGWSDEFYNENKDKEAISKFVECFEGGGTISPKILDLGCGVGYDSMRLSEFGARVVGVDLSEKLIAIAREKMPEQRFFVGDITEKLTSLGKFEGVLCLATIMHVGIEKLKQTFENIAEVLYEGGLLLLSAYDGVGKNMKKSLVKVKGENFDQDFNNYSAEVICSLAHPQLKLVDTWKFNDFDDGWRYYVFTKIKN